MVPDNLFDPDPLIPRERPGYAEAYPRLDFIKAQKAIQEGRTICIFERQGRGRIGQFEFGSYESDEPYQIGLMNGQVRIWPDYHLLGSSVEVAFRLRPAPIGVDHHRNYVLCPSCERRKTVLVYKKAWKCKDCHGLLMRSQLIDPRARLKEKIAKLEDKVVKGRPKGMHNTTYQNKLELLREFKAREARIPIDYSKVVSRDHDRIVTSRWVNMVEDAEFQQMFIPYHDDDPQG